MNWLVKTFGPNWRTTIGGYLVALPTTVVAAATGAGVHLPPMAMMVLLLVGGFGGLMIGVTAKDAKTHSTVTQVEAATIKADTAQPPKS